MLKRACSPSQFDAVRPVFVFQPRGDIGDAPEPDDVAASKDAGAGRVERDGLHLAEASCKKDPHHFSVARVPQPRGEGGPAFSAKDKPAVRREGGGLQKPGDANKIQFQLCSRRIKGPEDAICPRHEKLSGSG